MKTTARYAIALIAAGTLGACSGGAKSVPLAPAASAGNAGTTGSQSAGRAVFQLTIPGQTTSAHARATKHVAPTTASVTISTVITGQSSNPVVVNVTPGSPGCTTTNGATTCTIPVNAPAGTDTFEIFSYDAQNAGGNVLSHGKIAVAIGATATTNVPVALDGVVTAVSLVLSQSTIPTTAGTDTLTLDAFDPDGNIIAGGGNFIDVNLNPVTFALTKSGPSSGLVTLGATSVTSPATSSVTVTFAGGAATSTTFSTQASTTANISGAAVLNFGTAGAVLYATTSFGISAFAQGATGGNPTTPLRTIGIGKTGIPQPQFGAVADSHGNLYLAGTDVTFAHSFIFVYAPGVLLGSSPTKTIPLPAGVFPGGANGGGSDDGSLAIDPHDNLFVSGEGSVTEYATGSFVDGTPAAALGTLTGMPGPDQGNGSQPSLVSTFAVDSSENIYIVHGLDGSAISIDVVPFPAGTSADFSTLLSATPNHRHILLSVIDVASVAGIAIDAAGNIYEIDSSVTGVHVFAAGATSSTSSTPLFTIAGAATTLVAPRCLTVDGNGDVSVYDEPFTSTPTASVKAFGAKALFGGAATQNVAPTRTITGIATDFDGITASLTSNKLYLAHTNGVDVYAALANGNAPSSRLIAVPPFAFNPLAAGSDGTIYELMGSSLFAYAPGASGTASPAHQVNFVATGTEPGALATDPLSGEVYVSFGQSNIVRLPKGATTATPDRTITLTTLVPNAIGVSATGNMYVFAGPNGKIVVFPATATTESNGINTTTVTTTTTGMGLDDVNHRLYSADSQVAGGTYPITIFSSTLPGTTTAALVNLGGFTESAVAPSAVAVDAGGRLYVAGITGATAQIAVFNAPPLSGTNVVPDELITLTGESSPKIAIGN